MVLLPSLQPITVRTRVYDLIKQTSSLSRDERDVVKTALVNALIPRAPSAGGAEYGSQGQARSAPPLDLDFKRERAPEGRQTGSAESAAEVRHA
jgi:hypothetical protein